MCACVCLPGFVFLPACLLVCVYKVNPSPQSLTSTQTFPRHHDYKHKHISPCSLSTCYGRLWTSSLISLQPRTSHGVRLIATIPSHLRQFSCNDDTQGSGCWLNGVGRTQDLGWEVPKNDSQPQTFDWLRQKMHIVPISGQQHLSFMGPESKKRGEAFKRKLFSGRFNHKKWKRRTHLKQLFWLRYCNK